MTLYDVDLGCPAATGSVEGVVEEFGDEFQVVCGDLGSSGCSGPSLGLARVAPEPQVDVQGHVVRDRGVHAADLGEGDRPGEGVEDEPEDVEQVGALLAGGSVITA